MNNRIAVSQFVKGDLQVFFRMLLGWWVNFFYSRKIRKVQEFGSCNETTGS